MQRNPFFENIKSIIDCHLACIKTKIMNYLKKLALLTIVLFFNTSITAQICWEQAEFITDENTATSIEVIDIEYSNIPQNDRIIIGMHLDDVPYIVAINNNGEFDSTFNFSGSVPFNFEENLELIDFDLNVINGEIFALLRSDENFYTVKIDENGAYDSEFGENGYVTFEAFGNLEINITDIRIHNGVSVNLVGIFLSPTGSGETELGMLRYDHITGEPYSEFQINVANTIVDVLNENNPVNHYLENVNRIDEKLFFIANNQNNNRTFGYIKFDGLFSIAIEEDEYAIFGNNIEYTFDNGVYHFPYEPLIADGKEFIRHGSVSLNMAIAIKEENLGAIYMHRNFEDSITTFSKKSYCLPGNLNYLDFEIGDHNWNDEFRHLYFVGTQNGQSFIASSTEEQVCLLENDFVSSNAKHIKFYNKSTTSEVDSVLVFEEHLDGDFQFDYSLNLYEKSNINESDCLSVINSVTQYPIEISEMEIFPNPITGREITISFNSLDIGEIELTLFDMLGKKLSNFNLNNIALSGSNSINVDLPKNILKGIYVIQIQKNKSIVSKKLLVQ